MKVLVIEFAADGLLDLALRAQDNGHQVRYCLTAYDPVKAPVGRGMVERCADWRSSIRWADLVLVGGNGKCGQEFDRWQHEGVPIIGAGSEAAEWELDRLRGMEVFRKAGIQTPPFRHCNSYEEALAFVLHRDSGLAIKPSGDVADKSLSFVAKSPEEAVWRLQRWKKEGKRFPHGLILQDRIEGIEMAVGAWFGPDGFAPGWEENFEEKKLFAGALGPNCGEAGTVMRFVRSSKLADKVMKPIEDDLARTGYVGNIDVNCIIDESGVPWPLEFTVRFGYPAINIEIALHRGDPIEFLAGLAAGDPPNSRRLNEVAVGIVCAIPPYPYPGEKKDEVVGVPIWGLTPGIEDNVHLCDACISDAPTVTDGEMGREQHLVTAGSYVLVSTGVGFTVVEARSQAERVLKRLTIPVSPFYRIDIGTRLRSQIDSLNENGYAIGLRYA